MKNLVDPIREKTKWMTWALCMAIFAVLESILFIYRQYNPQFYSDMVVLQCTVPLTCAFIGIVLTQPSVRRYADVLLAEGFILWYMMVLVRNGHYFWLEYPQHIIVFYRLALSVAVCYPVAYALASKAQWGAMRGVLAVLALVLVAIAVLCVYRSVIREPLVSPFTGSELGLRLDLDGKSLRLFPIVHANTGGAIFMMTLLLCVFLSLSAKRVWGKALFAAAGVPVYVALALTNSRTSMLLAAFGLGLLGFLAMRKRMAMRKPLASWLLSILCAVLVTGACFAGYQAAIWGVNQATRISVVAKAPAEARTEAPTETSKEPKPTAQAEQRTPAKEEVDPEQMIEQRELLQGAGTFNGRTKIWAKVLSAVAQQPKVLLQGLTIERTEAFVSKLVRGHSHPHSAFIQVLLYAGLPGLLLLLGLVFCLVRFGLRLFLDCSTHTGLAQRFLPVILLCSVGMALIEVTFFSGQTVADRLFFLVAGYVAVLARQLAEKKNEM